VKTRKDYWLHEEWRILDQVSNYELLKKDPVPWNL
jgi:hypothetical protein